MGISLAEQVRALHLQVVREKRRGNPIDALEEAERTMRRLEALRQYIIVQRDDEDEDIADTLADEMVGILKLTEAASTA